MIDKMTIFEEFKIAKRYCKIKNKTYENIFTNRIALLKILLLTQKIFLITTDI